MATERIMTLAEPLEQVESLVTAHRTGKLAAALAKAQGEMGGAKKDSKNPFFNSKYADLASVLDACRGPLSRNGIAVVQKPSTRYIGEPSKTQWKSKNGEDRYGVSVITEVTVTTVLMHESGESDSDAVSCLLAQADPQAVGSAITYLRRYGLQAMVGVAPEEDDGEAAMAPPRNGAAYNWTDHLIEPDVQAVIEAAKIKYGGKGHNSKAITAHLNKLAQSLGRNLTVEAMCEAVKASDL